jgi:hypothetical protein
MKLSVNKNIVVNCLKISVLSLVLVLLFQLFQSIITVNIIVNVFDKIDFSDKFARVITCLLFVYIIIRRFIKSANYVQLDSNSVILLCTCFIVYTFYRFYPHPHWDFANILSNGIKYGDIIYVFVIEYLIIYAVIRIKKVSNQSESLQKQQDLADSAIKTESEDKFGYYSNSNDLVHRIISNPNYYSERALCIGIQAAWGSGKTSFLNLMQYAVEKDKESNNYNKAIIVKFNPWFSKNSEQITQDFLRSLSDALHKYNPNISSEISRYSKVLSSSELGWLSKLLKVYFGNKVKPIEKEFNKLGYCISCILKPVIIFIDDVDRLESDEIMMVLQLIRNVANFRNTTFIVTYDKKYVLDTIKKPEKYLEKIFTTNYSLPIVHEEKKSEVIAELIKNSLLCNEEEEISIKTFLIDIETQLSIRNIKNILNQVSIKRQQLLSYKLQDIYLYDLLLIEYLHFKYPEVYSKLPNTGVNKILYEQNESICLKENHLGKKLSPEELASQYLNLIDLKDESGKIALKILELLFTDSPIKHPNPYRLRYSSIFNLFFGKSKDSNLIIKQDFDNTLLKGSNLELKNLIDIYDKDLIIRLLQTFKFSNESEGLLLLSKALILIPESYFDISQRINNYEKALFITGENYLTFQYDNEYRKLYLKILKKFFEDNKKDELINLNKKFYLLYYSERFSQDIFQSDLGKRVPLDSLNFGFGKIYLSYLKRYLSFNPTFDKFETTYIEFLEKIYDKQRQDAKGILTDYIGRNLQSFIEQATDFSSFVEKFALERIFSKPKDKLNDDLENWIIQYKSFLDNQPTNVTERDWFKNHRTMIN